MGRCRILFLIFILGIFAQNQSFSQSSPFSAAIKDNQVLPPSPPQEIPSNCLAVDDGTPDNNVGLIGGGQFIWLNVFSPPAGDFPLNLTEVSVIFGNQAFGDGGVPIGGIFDIYVYEDTDGDHDPGIGANLLGSILGATVQANDGTTYISYPFAAPVTYNGPGDVIVALVNRNFGLVPNTFPAAIDQSSFQMRSWVGLYAGNVPPNPTFPAPNAWGKIDDDFGIPGNWTIRAKYTVGEPIPTLSQWGLIGLGLVFMILGTVAVKTRVRMAITSM